MGIDNKIISLFSPMEDIMPLHTDNEIPLGYTKCPLGEPAPSGSLLCGNKSTGEIYWMVPPDERKADSVFGQEKCHESDKYLLIYLISGLSRLSLKGIDEMSPADPYNKCLDDIVALYRKNESKELFFMIFDAFRTDNMVSFCNFAYLLSLIRGREGR